MPESVRWLLVQNKRKQAIRIIRRSAKMNGVELDEDDLYRLELGAAGRHLSMRSTRRPSLRIRRSIRRHHSSAASSLSRSPTARTHPRMKYNRSASCSPTPLHPKPSIKFGRSLSIISRTPSVANSDPPPPKSYSFVDIIKRWKFLKIALNVWFNW